MHILMRIMKELAIGCGTVIGIILLIVAIVNYWPVFLIAGALGLIVYLAYLYDKKQKQIEREREEYEAQRKLQEEQQRQEQLKRKQEQEKKRQEQEEDRKYDQIINCPYCKGTGEVYAAIIDRAEEIKTYADGYEEIVRPAETLTLAFDKDIENKEQCKQWVLDRRVGERHTFVYMDYHSCLFCEGKGIAYAWFESLLNHTERCTNCQGKGKIATKVKLEIGVGEEYRECAQCGGQGEIYLPEKKIVHVKTLTGSYEGDSEYKYDQLSMPYETWTNWTFPDKFCMDINDTNRQFYSKSKPRPLPKIEIVEIPEETSFSDNSSELLSLQMESNSETPSAFFPLSQTWIWGIILAILVVGSIFLALQRERQSQSQSEPSGEGLQMQERNEPFLAVTNSNTTDDKKSLLEVHLQRPYEYECSMPEVDRQIGRYEEFVKQFPESIFVPEALANIVSLELYLLQCDISNQEKMSRLEKVKTYYLRIFSEHKEQIWGRTAKEIYEVLLRNEKNIDDRGYSEIRKIHDKLISQIPLCEEPS